MCFLSLKKQVHLQLLNGPPLQFPDGAGVSQVCWVTGATDLLIALEEYLSRRLPALRCQIVCLLWQKPEPFDHSLLNFDFGSRGFWTIKITYVWWISFTSAKLAVSCYPLSPEPSKIIWISPHTWVPTPSTPGDLTTFTYWRFYGSRSSFTSSK
ncbi:hypothetical protein AMECASPLE_027030 [Ameca splendens]|uniref:Uncharacterized protein n=1 Tax=Ameca splendens TaxID=208324 RepID=A0ABV1ACJ1_9TELE